MTARNTSESNEDHADTSQHANKYDEHTSTNLNTDAIKNGPIPPARTPMPSSTTTNTSRNTNESDNKHDNASTIPTSTTNMPTPTSMTTNGPRLARHIKYNDERPGITKIYRYRTRVDPVCAARAVVNTWACHTYTSAATSTS